MAVEVPEILNRIALSGDAGLPVPDAPDSIRDIELCRRWGFEIRVENDRARLGHDEDALVPAWIVRETPALLWDNLRVSGFFETVSTNEDALAQASAGGGLVVYAESQTGGRGRKGRRWNSPPKAGLYFSIVVRSTQPQNRWPLLSHVASVALVDALKEIDAGTGRPLDIDLKWPNDVLLSEKKVAGILLETAHGGAGDTAAVIGIGINIRPECVPEELRHAATSLETEIGAAIPRRRLLVHYLSHFQRRLQLFESGEHAGILDLWKSRSTMWNGASVYVVEGSTARPAVTCGLTEIGALRIRTKAGIEEIVLAGDVSVRRAEK
jgi:BirA family biotin operon repressor/biotin-[acetyl-CoA-carboxylase] ligase